MNLRDWCLAALMGVLVLLPAGAQQAATSPASDTAAPSRQAPVNPPAASQQAPAPAPSGNPPLPATTVPLPIPVIKVPAPAPPRPTLLLAYWPPEDDSDKSKPAIDTIAIVDGNKFIDPWARTSDIPGEVNKWIPHFDRTFFPKGRAYAIYEGGQRVDTATVLQPQSITCDSLSAAVKLSTPGPARKALGGGRPRDLHANWQKAPTEAQKEAFLGLAQDLLAPQGVAANQISVVNLAATRVDDHAPALLVGDITGGAQRAFLIAEAERGGGYKIAISSLHDTSDDDEGVDEHEQFLDQLDITGDGVDEIVSIGWYAGSWDYNIYRRNAKGAWEKLYHGGGGGC